MEHMAFTVSAPNNPAVTIQVIPGHFSTSNLHLNHYLDFSSLKSSVVMTKSVARELAKPYLTSTLINTIVCMEGTQMIGAYLAQELMKDGTFVINSSHDIHIITPISSVAGKLVFHSSTQDRIRNQNILLLVASVSSGKTIRRAQECLHYYGGTLVGISALFHAKEKKVEQEIHSIFTCNDIPGYQLFLPSQCPICKEGCKLDARVNSEGYTKLIGN